MQKYRKPDQDYYDRYDRYTIDYLKPIEAEEKKEFPKVISKGSATLTLPYKLVDGFRDKAIARSRDREDTIRQWIRADEQMDALVEKHRPPEDIFCDTCNTRMFLSGHLFEAPGYNFLFVFTCPTEKHKPNKLIHPKGGVVLLPKRKCEKCGGHLKTNRKKKNFLLVIKDTCMDCGYEETFELDKTPNAPVSEEDRKKYCLAFEKELTQFESFKKFYDLKELVDEFERKQALKNDNGTDIIEKVSIPKLKELLGPVIKEAGYIEFELEKPEFKRQVIMAFSVQDPSNRLEKDSIKELSKVINKTLVKTNWRLMLPGISYRLGYLTGKLKGYEDEESLMELVKKIGI